AGAGSPRGGRPASRPRPPGGSTGKPPPGGGGASPAPAPPRAAPANPSAPPPPPPRRRARHPTPPPPTAAASCRRTPRGTRAVDEVDREYALDPEAPEVTFDRGDAAIARAKAALANSDLARLREVAAGTRPPRPLAAVTWQPHDAALDELQRAAVDAGLRSG